MILGEHVTTEAGTGAVHTAPGHGQEDYVVGRRYGCRWTIRSAATAVFLPDTELFAGQHVFKANESRHRGAEGDAARCCTRRQLRHSYPHCWRHKTPMIFRATPQWFISMEQNEAARRRRLRDIQTVEWIPDWGQARIAGMIENRPDWCISRQRTWGVPIALFVHRQSGELHPRSAGLDRGSRATRRGARASTRGSNSSRASCSATMPTDYEKITDILDVWFDSGVTHFAVLRAARGARRFRPTCTWKAPTSIAAGSSRRC